MSQNLNKNQKKDYFFTKEQKNELTHKAFWHFAAAYQDRRGVDLFEFQKKFRSMLYPNRQTPINEDQKKLQHYQDVQINRIIQISFPKMFPNVEIVKEESPNLKKKSRPFIRLKTYNYQVALERTTHKEFLNSDIVKMSGLTNKLLAKNIIANRHLIDKYGLKDRKDKDGISEKFSEKNIQKWKEGVAKVPNPLLLLLLCAVHKWVEANAKQLSRGRPRKMEVDSGEYAQFVVGVQELMDLGNNPVFNSTMLPVVFSRLLFLEDIDVAMKNGLSNDETVAAIWNLYGKEISWNPEKNEEDYFTKDHLLIEVKKKQAANKQLADELKKLGVPEGADNLEAANSILSAFGIDLKGLAQSEIVTEKRKEMFGELINTYYDYAAFSLKLYNNIYQEFRLVDLSGAYVNQPKKVKKESIENNESDEYIEADETEENEINQEEYKDPEDYYGV